MKYSDPASDQPPASNRSAFSSGSMISQRYPIIVHSHLRWDWVWQRPQQFLSRLSRRHKILFVEAPAASETIETSRLSLREVTDYPNIVVLQIEVPAAHVSNQSWVDQERRRVVKSVLAGPLGRSFESPLQWFYDPMAVTAFAGQMGEIAVVYDCMDELSLFRGAPPELIRRERELLAFSDIVFAGGPKIWEAKRLANPNCFCFGCGVDEKHFAQARNPDFALPADVAMLPSPRFGYFGVVDERIDYALVDALAASTSGSVLMVGPWTKVDPSIFPRRDNLHWLGGRDYAQLPSYARAFDVCLMPFALNDATRFINPTKSLEYMATGRPIVSTEVEDVVRQFSDVVTLAQGTSDFIAKCKEAAQHPDRPALERGLKQARNSSWESIVRKIESHINEVLAKKQALETDAA